MDSQAMKRAILLSAILLSGCAQLTTGHSPDKPKLIAPARNLLMTECNGPASEFDQCYIAAKQACPVGYEVIDWVRNYGSITRQIIFKCM